MPISEADTLVSELLCQRVTKKVRDEIFAQLTALRPTWEEIADAPSREIIEAILDATPPLPPSPDASVAVPDCRSPETGRPASVFDVRAWGAEGERAWSGGLAAAALVAPSKVDVPTRSPLHALPEACLFCAICP